MAFPILTFYKFISLPEPEQTAETLRTLLKQNLALGTILISQEGVNGSISASSDALDILQREFSRPEIFGELTVKRHTAKTAPFRYMNMIHKKEIITFRQEGIDPEFKPGARVSPEEFRTWLTNNPDEVVVIDTRNQFEIGFGKFKGAKDLGLVSFTEFAAAAKKLPEEYKKKKVVTYCTGGIRCEKAVPYMNSLGFEQVYQLDGGILNYFARVGGEHWEGECFVFDNRVAVDANLEETDASFCCRCQVAIRDPLVKKLFTESERFCLNCQDTVPDHLKARWQEFLRGKNS